MCGYDQEKEKPVANPNEITPTGFADALQAALNTSDTVNPNVIARAGRGLGRWLERVYECIDGRTKKLEAKLKATADLVRSEQKMRMENRGRLNELEKLRDGDDFGSVQHSNSLAAAVVRLEGRLDAHIQGNLDTPFGTLRGPGPLIHEKHPHKRGQHIPLSDEEKDRVMKGETDPDVIFSERNAANEAVDGILNSDLMQRFCPDVPQGLERARPVYCHRCGVKL